VDPIGSSSCGGGSGAALVVISRASYDALINLNATNVTVTSDEGEWVRMGQSAPFLAERIAFGLLFWPIALWSLLLGAAAVVKEGRSYDVRKYSNTIYWLLFASATLLAVDCTVDPYGFNGLLTVGQWMYIRYAGSMATLGMTCLLISAWARVVAVVPISKLSWLAACLIQIAIFGCYTVMVVTCMYAGSRFTVLVAAGPRYSSMALSFAITGSLQFVLCCSSLFFGVWLLIVLTRVSSPTSSHSVTMVKTTLLMLASSGVQLMFGVLTHIQAHLFLTPQLYFGIVTFTHILSTLFFYLFYNLFICLKYFSAREYACRPGRPKSQRAPVTVVLISPRRRSGCNQRGPDIQRFGGQEQAILRRCRGVAIGAH